MPENAPALMAVFKIKIGDQIIEKKRPVVYKYTDQVRGEVYQPLVIAPPVTATLSEKAFIFNGNEAKSISVLLKSFKDNASGVLAPQVPSGWKVSPQKIDFTLAKKEMNNR